MAVRQPRRGSVEARGGAALRRPLRRGRDGRQACSRGGHARPRKTRAPSLRGWAAFLRTRDQASRGSRADCSLARAQWSRAPSARRSRRAAGKGQDRAQTASGHGAGAVRLSSGAGRGWPARTQTASCTTARKAQPRLAVPPGADRLARWCARPPPPRAGQRLQRHAPATLLGPLGLLVGRARARRKVGASKWKRSRPASSQAFWRQLTALDGQQDLLGVLFERVEVILVVGRCHLRPRRRALALEWILQQFPALSGLQHRGQIWP